MSSKMGSHMIKAGKDCMEVPGIFTLCQHYGLRPSLLTWWEKGSHICADQVAISPSFIATVPSTTFMVQVDVCFTIPTTSLWSLDTISQQTRMMEKKQSAVYAAWPWKGHHLCCCWGLLHVLNGKELSWGGGCGSLILHGAGGFYKI